ncbi:hypothetical protein YC2023_018470 [Brassica napus]
MSGNRTAVVIITSSCFPHRFTKGASFYTNHSCNVLSDTHGLLHFYQFLHLWLQPIEKNMFQVTFINSGHNRT